MTPVSAGSESHRKILVAFGVCLLSLAGLGVGDGSLSLYVVPISQELGVPRTTYVMYDTFAKVTGCILSIFFPTIYKRTGARGLAVLAGSGYVLEFVCLASASNIAMVWLGGVFGGVGFAFAGTLAIFAVLPTWYPKTIGTVSGIAGSMSGISASIFIQLVVGWIRDYGYRQALFLEAGIIAFLCIIAFLLVRSHPNDPVAGEKTLQAEKEGRISARRRIGGTAFYKNLLSSPAALLAMVIFFMVGGLGNSFSQSIVPIADARGFTIGAAVLSIHYLVSIPAKIGAGFLRDKIGLGWITPAVFMLVIASTLMVGFGSKRAYYAVGITYGLGTVVNQTYPLYLVMAAFGKYYNAGMIGIYLAMWQVGNAVGVPLIHLSYDRTGSYTTSLLVWTGLWVILWGLCTLMLRVGKNYQLRLDTVSDGAAG